MSRLVKCDKTLYENFVALGGINSRDVNNGELKCGATMICFPTSKFLVCTPLATPLVGAFNARLSATKFSLVGKIWWMPKQSVSAPINFSDKMQKSMVRLRPFDSLRSLRAVLSEVEGRSPLALSAVEVPKIF